MKDVDQTKQSTADVPKKTAVPVDPPKKLNEVPQKKLKEETPSSKTLKEVPSKKKTASMVEEKPKFKKIEAPKAPAATDTTKKEQNATATATKSPKKEDVREVRGRGWSAYTTSESLARGPENSAKAKTTAKTSRRKNADDGAGTGTVSPKPKSAAAAAGSAEAQPAKDEGKHGAASSSKSKSEPMRTAEVLESKSKLKLKIETSIEATARAAATTTATAVEKKAPVRERKPAKQSNPPRYFLVKSSSQGNVALSRRKSIWSTFENKLAMSNWKAAFKRCEAVYLFFCVEDGTRFAGYCTMKSEIREGKANWVDSEGAQNERRDAHLPCIFLRILIGYSVPSPQYACTMRNRARCQCYLQTLLLGISLLHVFMLGPYGDIDVLHFKVIIKSQKPSLMSSGSMREASLLQGAAI